MDLIIPKEIVSATQMSAAELTLEIAIMLYKQEKISSGKASEWLGISSI